MQVEIAPAGSPTEGAVAFVLAEGAPLGPSAAAFDAAAHGQLSRALAVLGLSGKKDQTLRIAAPAGTDAPLLVVLGIGDPGKLDAAAAQALGGRLVGELQGSGVTSTTLVLDPLDVAPLSAAEIAAEAACGARLRGYGFKRYKTREAQNPDRRPDMARLQVQTTAAEAAAPLLAARLELAAGVALTRDLINEPANILYPESYVAQVSEALAGQPVEIEVLGPDEMRALGMGALLGVAQGSERPPRLMVMTYRGAADGAETLVVVGKGITFDTGGISIKPAQGMEEMKTDMSGAGVVAGLMRAIAGRRARINLVGIAVLAENMPSGTAQRPGDVVTSMSGQTIEVLNTDAEGRLVLADALWYARDRFKPTRMIDLATLTGACIIALGNEFAGLFANDEALAEQLTRAGRAAGEPLWRLPLAEAFDRALDSDVADMKNISGERGAGASIGAQFLQRFVKDCAWAHLDIAGVSWPRKDKPTVPKGASGFGVRLLDRFIADLEEGRAPAQ